MLRPCLGQGTSRLIWILRLLVVLPDCQTRLLEMEHRAASVVLVQRRAWLSWRYITLRWSLPCGRDVPVWRRLPHLTNRFAVRLDGVIKHHRRISVVWIMRKIFQMSED